jgi:hypothetical protein
MHDPMTVAHEIRTPWYTHRPWPKGAQRWDDLTSDQQSGRSRHWREGYRNSMVTIWHVDPERDGSDDSCGYSYPPLSRRQLERLKNAAWTESKYPYFLRRSGRVWTGSRHEAECLYRGMVLLVADVLDFPITFEAAAKHAAHRIHHPACSDNARVFCFEPGYHSNSQDDTPEWRERHFHGILCSVARELLREARPWYRHPRWHIHHWKIQVHFIQELKRWLFSRCAHCGRGFSWGYCPMSGSWSGTGPRWFRNEANVYHGDCPMAGAKPQPMKPAHV